MDKRFPIEDQIEMLATALRGRVVTPAATDYDALRAVATDNFDRRPAALIRVANAADVAAVVNFARATDLPLAIRSGGHSTAGYSSIDHGLVIDLRALDGIEIDVAARTAWVGSGLTAGAVTRAVEQHGLIVGFGDAGTVGVGGLTLGGGVGYLVRKHGLTIDSLLAAELVTADGDIVIADAGSHSDLFWAIRGGGGNFGVVTRLQFRLHPLPFFYGGPLVLPATAEVIAAYVAAAEAAPETLSTIGNVMPLPPVPFVPAEMHGRLALVAMLAYAGERDGAEAALAPFRALAAPIADLVREAPYSSMYAMDPPPEVRPSVAIRSRYVTRFGIAEAAALLAALEASDAPMKLASSAPWAAPMDGCRPTPPPSVIVTGGCSSPSWRCTPTDRTPPAMSAGPSTRWRASGPSRRARPTSTSSPRKAPSASPPPTPPPPGSACARSSGATTRRTCSGSTRTSRLRPNARASGRRDGRRDASPAGRSHPRGRLSGPRR